jgi:hypothetical protein
MVGLGLVAALAAAVTGFGGCSAGGDSAFDDDDDDDGQGASGGHSSTTTTGLGGSLFDGGSGASGGAGGGCSTASEFVYVIDENNGFYKFDPTIASPSAFSLIGTLNCSSGGGPNSMDVSREGFAYVLFGEADVWTGQWACRAVHRVDINTAQCLEAIPFGCGSQGFSKFGMGYATDTADTTAEKLYLGNSLAAEFGTLDTTSGAVQLLGDLPNQGPEFTGNAAGELWGFFPYETPPAAIALNKANGSALQTLPLGSLPNIDEGYSAAWAFAYWGGSFYIFYMVNPPNSSSVVYKLNYDGTVTTHIANTGLVIVGAGVSTCAPITPPR